jgi:sulfatase maturation enzyme AslB (radical SAM superfamily)
MRDEESLMTSVYYGTFVSYNKKMWCPLPWLHLGIKNNGDLRMCSHSQSFGTGNALLMNKDEKLSISHLGSIDVMNCDTLKDVRKNMMQGHWPEQCRRCKEESPSGKSRNVWETKRHSKWFDRAAAENITQEDGSISQSHLVDLDIRIGNLCNLRCVMCHPGEATRWYDDYQEITGWDHFHVDDTKYLLADSKDNFSWSSLTDNIDRLVNSVGKLRRITFGGGEPLMIKHHNYLLKKLIDMGLAGDMEIEYSSNLTVFPHKVVELWDHFKLIKICASIDGVGDVNEAIRYYTKWDNVVKNLRWLDSIGENVEVFISSTIGILNLQHYGDLLAWIDRENFSKIKYVANHPIYNPIYFNISILDHDQFHRMLESSLDAAPSRWQHHVSRYADLHLKIKPDLETILEQRRYFVRIFDNLANRQSQNWRLLFPMAADARDAWEKPA